MVVDQSEFESFGSWFYIYMVDFSMLALFMLVGWAILAFALAAIRNSPIRAAKMIAGTIKRAFMVDFPSTSIRRTMAMSRLAIQEAIRNKVLIIFVLFVALLLFAGWFLDVENDHPARLYLGFVLSASTYLLLALAMFLSAFSLPNDIKNRTIYTITTKPVRAHEIFLGRVFGFAAVGTLLLVLMASVSYGFVIRGLDHEHTIDKTAIEWDESTGLGTGKTSLDGYHRHDFTINEKLKNADGLVGTTELSKGHAHNIYLRDGDYIVEPPTGDLLARVPVYGKLSFLDRYGQPSEEGGLNVGKEWTYRSYIEGNTLSTAIWEFENLTKEMFVTTGSDDGVLPLELNLRVFRSTKGKIESRIHGEILLVNPEETLSSVDRFSAPIPFEADEFVTSQVNIKFSDIRRQNPVTGELQNIDLFKDLVDSGKLQVHIRCKDHAQFFGMARADVYIRAPEGSFEANLIKCYLGIWMQMLLVILLGVFFSTFLNGIVALISSVAIVAMGMFAGFIGDIQTGEAPGGGPIESIVRNITQQGATLELEMGDTAIEVIESLDGFYLNTMESLAKLAPDFSKFNMSAKVAYGYDIHLNLILRQLVTTMVYFFVLVLAGYFILTSREIAA
ncbi:MAG: ABC transporter permease [Planctomycetaceae bacterium]|jgi:hypothetical protein|nr:ABC transporter permease [Planctomycetaceae bacterium]MBT4726757.1 ABC transporter permease [Planctomycetaceae bacterium]MBT4844574.1 ABC transporter permease [Planctomycetaceae bacterium]MBT5123633.1 ABC transporter permease [Planctomycetaceae bacterium]MBT5597796.1 ABC transporter permease [Planctomycetaceae bacterium]